MDVRYKFLVDQAAPHGRKWRKDRLSGKELGQIRLGDRLAKGGTSVVYRAQCGKAIITCKVTDGKYSEGLMKECEILRKLDHTNILKVYDGIACNRIVAMAMEFVPCGDLHDFVTHHFPVHSETRQKFGTEILSAVSYMHDNGIAHCDLKLENILVDTQGSTKIIDFGSALKVADATYEDFAYIATTPEYLPPEIFCTTTRDGYDIRAIDEWSVGVVLFILLTGRFPFGEVDASRIAKYIQKMRAAHSFNLRQNEEMLLYFEKEYLEVARGLLAFDPEERFSVSKALQMGFTKKKSVFSLDDIESEIDKEFGSIFDDI
ncbi:uncharacterized protein LOC128226541 [Mya arenaria]|uniref:uncharacterized protein LOC128226541 n=1 Tax=Mya arenaria TaxID=6604 RepID=UPI0022E0E739|nr:uncharacterized protein LOC128226541 [Mya arenaria]